MGKLFEKGNPGRPVGSKNKSIQSLRQRIDALLDSNWDRIQEDLNKLDSKQRLDFISSILPYCVPKLAASTSEVSIKNKLEELPNEKLELLIEHILQDDDL